MIPAEDLARLAPSPHLTIVRTRHGGHCGFVERINAPSFADRFVVAQFDRFRRETGDPDVAPVSVAQR
jgi:predicted alpha/beta-fold hydrolase